MTEQLTALFAVVLLLSGLSRSLAEDSEPRALARQGRALAERMCAHCHAVGASGPSPHSAAPAFRTLNRRVDLDAFTNRLREGLISGHPDMPVFRFTREDARALTAYLRSIQAP
jgi:cytochrome c